MSSKRATASLFSLAVIGLVSCSMLTYEILLTRISALRLLFHFGFLIISNALLGIGASGTLISICQETWKERPRFWIALFSFLYLVSLVLTYAFLLTFQIGYTLQLWRFADFSRFFTYNLVAALPFFFGGTVVGTILTFNAEQVNTVYFFDLAGAGLGCLLCPFLLSKYGAGGCFVLLALLALMATVVAVPPKRKKAVVTAGIVVGVLGIWLLPTFDKQFPVPGKDLLDFTDKVRMPIARVPDFSQWSSNSRVDLVPVADKDRFIFGRGNKTAGLPPIPEEKIILQDGSAGTFILNFSEHPECLKIIERSMFSVSMQLKERPRVFVLGVGGGNDLWAAEIHEASAVKGVELNQSVLDVHRKVLPTYSRTLLDDPRIHLVCAEGRNALTADTDTYDIIQMTGLDTWTALVSGAYVLAENYLYTREAIESMYARLAEGGILQISRIPGPSESLRLVSNIYSAFEAEGIPNFSDSIICIRNPHVIAVLVKKGLFTADEVNRTARFVREVGLEPVYLPGRSFGTLVETFIRTKDKHAFIRQCKTDISPTTDDRPYFFFFNKWRNPLSSTRNMRDIEPAYPMSTSFILWQLGVSAMLSVAFIVLPLVVFERKGIRRTRFKRFLVYFAGLGFGFIAVEIVAMQKLTLFLGHPLYSITVTLFSVLVFAGLGSLVSVRWFHPPDRRVWLVPLGLALLLVLFIFLSPRLVSSCIGLPLPARIAITVGVLAPISLLLGVPFAYGIRLLNRWNPSLIPWAWAVNGCCTVIGSILTVILSMNFGFNAVMLVAILTYQVAFAVLGVNHLAPAGGASQEELS